jgi:NAD-reducing hydrogenase large subunit
MSFALETAANPQNLRRVAIDPVSRVEGHGKVTLLLDDKNRIEQVRLHIVEFRGFEKFIEGRPYWEVPVMVQRLCGICPVSHHLAAAKAFDRVVGALPVTASADAVRRLMHYGQMLQSHALHFFHLSSPDLLFGFDSEVAKRNIVGVAQAHPEIAKKGILLRKFGQEIIRITSGKRVHGTGAIPGGINKLVTAAERDSLKRDLPQMLQWAQDSVDIAKQLHAQNPALYNAIWHLSLQPALLGTTRWRHGLLRWRAARARRPTALFCLTA